MSKPKEDKTKYRYTVVNVDGVEKIKKAGEFEIDFEIDELTKAINSYERRCKEIDGEVQVRSALVKNFTKANKKFTSYVVDENADLCLEFLTAYVELRDSKKSLEEARNRIADLEAEVAEITMQTGIKPTVPVIKTEKKDEQE